MQRPGHGVRVRVRAVVSDDVGVTGAAVGYRTRGENHVTRLRPKTARVWVGFLRWPDWNSRGTHQLIVRLRDGSGRVTRYDSRKRRFVDRTVAGPVPGDRTVTIVGGRAERLPPRGHVRGITPRAIDLRTADATALIRVRLRDRTSGVANATAELGIDASTTTLHKVSGTRRDGIWQGRVHFDHCSFLQSPHPLVDVTVTDRAGNTRTLPSAAVDAHVLRPEFVDVLVDQFDPTRSGPLQFRWSTDIAGISPDTAQVYSGNTVAPPPGESPVQGSWSCQTAAGQPTDCFTGPVRVSSFTPASALTDSVYTLLPNPRGSGKIDVTDFLGRPAEEEFSWEFE